MEKCKKIEFHATFTAVLRGERQVVWGQWRKNQGENQLEIRV